MYRFSDSHMIMLECADIGPLGANIEDQFLSQNYCDVIANDTSDGFYLPGIQMKNSLRIDCNK